MPSRSLSIAIVAFLLVLAAGLAACETTSSEGRSWPEDCVPLARPDPLGLDAAREAHRRSERRHVLRLREAAVPGSFLRAVHAAAGEERLRRGESCPAELAEVGELIFEHEYGPADGLGGGGRPAGGATGPFRRVHRGLFGGPETLSCPSCHWVGGPGGAGAETDNAFLRGDGDRPDSGDARNPPALLGLGVVQALAREMTLDLQRQRAELLRQAALRGAEIEAPLRTKGIDFGVLRASPVGEVQTSGVRGVDVDLVIKPFGWQGKLATFTDFAAEALQVHLGVQSDSLLARGRVELVGRGEDPLDPDGDGVRHEIATGAFAALAMHLALREMPIVAPLIQDRPLEPAAHGLRAPTTTSFAEDFQRGREHFHALGCAGCHLPRMVLESPELELEGLPPIDLSREMRQPGLRYDAELGGYPVWLFSDLKRHDMGPGNAARHGDGGRRRSEYLTTRLWGVADSAPYLHDGRAPSLDHAIAGHGGEGAAARDAFAALSYEEKGALRVYLMSLRRSSRLVVP